MPPVSRWMTHSLVALLFTLAAFAPAQAQQPPPRTFALGFTDVPHGLPFAPNDTRGAAWANIQTLGDMAVLHEDGLLPWQEALEQRYTDYPANYLAEIDYKAAQR